MYFEDCKKKFESLQTKPNVKILAIESSCDETAIAIVENGRKILSNVVSTQIDIHTRFGGVVPEVASRNHLLAIKNVCQKALDDASLCFDDIDAIAVTYGAGLIGALMVGVNYAKALAYALQKPLLATSHIHGHIAGNYVSHPDLTPPFVCLMISGGHTAIIQVNDYTDFHLLGTTVDDAVGECYDKVARVVGLGYPGGPKIDKLATQGKNIYHFANFSSLKDSYNFSFSGIKTAVINHVHNRLDRGEQLDVANIVCSFQEQVTDELCQKAIKACLDTNCKTLVCAGGVSANSRLKQKISDQCQVHDIKMYSPVLSLCTDNAAMIASAAYYNLRACKGLADLDLAAKSTVPIC